MANSSSLRSQSGLQILDMSFLIFPFSFFKYSFILPILIEHLLWPGTVLGSVGIQGEQESALLSLSSQCRGAGATVGGVECSFCH